MRKFIMGFISGALIFSMIGAVALSYIAKPIDFKVLVNGEEFVSDPPALEVEGRTYLPLRAMGDALGVPVNWNEELRQAEVGEEKYYTKETIPQYKTYDESKDVIDFGTFLGIVPAKSKGIFDGYVTYYYNQSEVDVDKILDYFELMESYGYTIKSEKKTFYYGINYNDISKNMFSLEFLEDRTALKFYIGISVFE